MRERLSEVPRMVEYSVYERNQGRRNFIGIVQAESYDEAVDLAHQEYGAPIEIGQ